MIVWKEIAPGHHQATQDGAIVATILWDGEHWRILLPILFETEDKARAWVERLFPPSSLTSAGKKES